jgi:hypothetical protein
MFQFVRDIRQAWDEAAPKGPTEPNRQPLGPLVAVAVFGLWLGVFGNLVYAYPNLGAPPVLDWPARIAWAVLSAVLSTLIVVLALETCLWALRLVGRTIREGDRRMGSWLETRSPRAAGVWQWWHSLYPYQWASLIGMALGLLWFAFYRLDGYLDGSRPLTRSELDGDIVGILAFYLLTLWFLGMAAMGLPTVPVGPVRLPVPRVSGLFTAYGGAGAAAEIFPASIAFLTSPLRWPFKAGWRAVRRRVTRRDATP